MTTDATHRVLVLGAGYAGLMAAIRTALRTRRTGGQVTLVNPSDRFTERLRMHQLAAGQPLADHRIEALVAGTGIVFVQGRATGISAARREVVVETADGSRVLPYDTLVYAIGSVCDTTMVPGAGLHACTLDDTRSALQLAGRLPAIAAAGGTVSVCGGGLTGVETAAEIAESWPGLRVELLSRDVPGAMLGDRARGYLERALERLGVRVRTGAEITKVLPDGVELTGGELVPADATVWTTGVRVTPLAADAGLTTDDRGRIVTDATLRSVSHPSVYAVGDAAAVGQTYGVIHGTCQSGIPTAVYAADAIAARLRGREPAPFRFGYIHQPVSLGRRDAVIQFTYGDDTPRRWYLKGRAAVKYKESVSSSPVPTYRMSRRYATPARTLWTHGGSHNRPVAAALLGRPAHVDGQGARSRALDHYCGIERAR
ncbi:NAD(P)/FAD-dependent oxidoreductase [Streptomyces sp. ISL-86]|uniref:NAD(P)/FAD-dependent oxidoreductase n=1 Tax=Streptomyces sp. ISL-86 TaxID=2819187 RepID=UPI001BED0BAF|nr:FAD-dependent oxidoreductase [Streptomyces sp. ISL-86]MBT2458977.1 FAD-dependent oxidoreductase [Streptomyces sp. ISL-86]